MEDNSMLRCLRTGRLYCLGGKDCYSIRQRCDGHKDCENGHDERPCLFEYTTTARPRYTISYKTSCHTNNHSGHANIGPILGVSAALAVVMICCCMAVYKIKRKRTPGTTSEPATPSVPSLHCSMASLTRRGARPALSLTTFMTNASAHSFELRVHNASRNVNVSFAFDDEPPSYDTLFPRPPRDTCCGN